LLYFVLKCAISGVMIGVASTLARRFPGFGALIASLPLVSVLGMIWLWREKPDVANMADHSRATFWYVLPSLPMFLMIPWLLKRNIPFWGALAAGCVVTVLLYLASTWLAPRLGLRL
jgi:hypothetical protein